MSEENVSYDAMLDRSIKLRESILTKLVSNNTVDKDDREFFTKMLDGLDRTILSHKKIKSDEKISANNMENARTIVADILSNLTVKNNLNVARVIDVDYVPTDIVHGETYIGIEDLTIEGIMNKT